jgi:3-hydroxyisobutyrate dehydrogenase-like beta-hydroxyacid dehydrogenase
MLLAIHMSGTAEALALGVANGLDRGVVGDHETFVRRQLVAERV